MPAPDYVKQIISGESASGGTTLVLTLGATVPSVNNRLMLVFAWTSAAARTVSSVVDSKGGVWTLSNSAAHAVSNSPTVAHYTSPNTVGLTTGDTITVTLTGTHTGMIGCMEEVTGCSGTVDASGTGTGTASNNITASLTTVAASTLTFAAYGVVARVVPGPEDVDYNTTLDLLHSVSLLSLHVAYRDRTTAGADTYAINVTGLPNWDSIVTSFGAQSAGTVNTTWRTLAGVGN